MVLAGIAAIALWGIWNLLPNEESVVRKRLLDLAAAASFEGKDAGLSRLLYGNKLRDFFSQDAELNIEMEGRDSPVIRSRGEVAQFATFAREKLQQAKFRLYDISVKLGAGQQTAEAHMTLLGDINGEKTAISQELKMKLKKIDGAWRITELETVRTLQ